ncbi:MAG: hypothetical protein ACRCXZ_00665 [Patescibacteria group bacterium]
MSNLTVERKPSFEFRKWKDIKDGEVILPELICNQKDCHSVIPHFWANNCPTCGFGAGDAKVNWNPHDQEATYMVLLDPELISRYQKEGSWVCAAPYGHDNLCLYLNDEDSEFCSNPTCGEDFVNYGHKIPTRIRNSQGFDTAVNTIRPLLSEMAQNRLQKMEMTVSGEIPKGSQRQTHTLFGGAVKVIVTASMLAVVTWQGMYWLMPIDQTGVVNNTHWQTTVNIEHLVPTAGEGWDYPSDAYNVSFVSKIKTYDKVEVGSHTEMVEKTKSVISGYKPVDSSTMSGSTITRSTSQEPVYEYTTVIEPEKVIDYDQVPVYANYYNYTVDSWQHKNSLDMYGDNTIPQFANAVLSSNERASNTCSASLQVTGEDGKEHKVGIPCAETTTWHNGEHISYKHNRVDANWAPKLD